MGSVHLHLCHVIRTIQWLITPSFKQWSRLRVSLNLSSYEIDESLVPKFSLPRFGPIVARYHGICTLEYQTRLGSQIFCIDIRGVFTDSLIIDVCTKQEQVGLTSINKVLTSAKFSQIWSLLLHKTLEGCSCLFMCTNPRSSSRSAIFLVSQDSSSFQLFYPSWHFPCKPHT